MSEHSKEPLHIEDHGMDGLLVISATGYIVARFLRSELANAERIVAAVNFCAGSDLKTELEFGPKTYKEAVSLLRGEIEALRAELDALKRAKQTVPK